MGVMARMLPTPAQLFREYGRGRTMGGSLVVQARKAG